MKRHRFFNFLMATGLMLVLSGCGGVAPPLMESPPIDLDTALAELKAVSNISDSLLVSDLVFTPAGETERVHGATSCGRTKCRTTVSGRPFLVYGLDADDPDFEGLSKDPVVEGGAFERYRGVSLGAFRERTYQREEYELRGMPVKIEIDTDILSYEGWMQYSKFGVQINSITRGFAQVGQDYYRDFTGQRYAVGSSTGQLSDANPVSGNATWRGVMVGGRISETVNIGKPVRGDATLTYDFAGADLDVALTNIRTLPIVQVPETYPNMYWQNLEVRNGRFGGGFDDPTIEGRFYGPNHEEVGGIFQRNRIVGAFGGQR